MPNETVAQVLGKQALRSGTYIGANTGSNRGRFKAEFNSKFGESLKEADETASWLELLAMKKSSLRNDLHLYFRKLTNLFPFLSQFQERARGE